MILRLIITGTIALPLYHMVITTGKYWAWPVVLLLQIFAGINVELFQSKDYFRRN